MVSSTQQRGEREAYQGKHRCKQHDVQYRLLDKHCRNELTSSEPQASLRKPCEEPSQLAFAGWEGGEQT